MKYRIRDTHTNEIVAPLFCDLSFNYFIGTNGVIHDCDFEPIGHFKPELEVADGVYEGDYLLVHQEVLGTSVYHIESYGILTIVGTNTRYSGNIKGFLEGVDFEVIKCR